MACSALASVSQTLEKILESDPYLFPCAKEKFEFFQRDVTSLTAFLDNCPPNCTGRIKKFRTDVRDSAYLAEDLFAAHFLQNHGSDNNEQSKIFYRSLERVMEDIASLGKQVKYVRQYAEQKLSDHLDNLSMADDALQSVSYYSYEILGFDPCFFPCTKEKITSFRETIISLMAFIEECPPIGTHWVNNLIKQIKLLAFDAEDIFETLHKFDSYTKVKVFPYSKEAKNIEVLHRRLEKVMEAIESVEKEVKKIHHHGKGAHEQRLLTIASSSRPALRGYNAEMKALDKDLEMKLMEQLVGVPSKVGVISIVGMGGIGKTTLARILFDSQLIKQSFDIRGWGTMSQTYNAREIVLGILEDIGLPFDGKKDAKQLLYQTLYGRKYFIVLDDVWNTQAWDDIKGVFPNDNKGSGILLTTRHSQVAAYANSSSFYHEMQLLNEESSWSLLCQEIFQQNICPPELVEIGKKITRQCQGLPLAISAIAGHLKMEKHTEEYWKYVSENVSSVLKTTDDPIFEGLTLSYNYLSYRLKACFLYFGSFKDHDIDVSELLKLWIAEGFVRPQIWNDMGEFSNAFWRRIIDRIHASQIAWHDMEHDMEEVAEEYLRIFIERNLVFVHKYDSSGKPKRCGIHDLFRDICTRESKKEKFHCLLDGNAVDVLDMNIQRRLTLVPNILQDNESPSCDIVSRNDCSPTIILKILGIGMRPTKFPVEILDLVNLKFLQLGHVQEIPSSLSRLRKLQTLVASSIYIKSLPFEIWEMQELMNLLIPGFLLPDIPYVHGKGTKAFANRRLLTLSEVIDFKCTQEVLGKVPNLKKLNIVYKGSFYPTKKITNLRRLQSLRCDFQFWPNDNISQNLAFPLSLKKLVLIGCQIPWEHMTIIGILPNLEVLKLKVGAMKGKLWETNDGEFKRVRFLLIRYSNLEEWTTEKDHFPNLRQLILQLCNDLHVFPCEIGDIPTLERIELHKCSHALESSAKEILGEDNDINLTISNYEYRNVNDTVARGLTDSNKQSCCIFD